MNLRTTKENDMDPTATCRLIAEALADNHQDEADEYSGNLVAWVGRGGFLPAKRQLNEIAEIAADSLEDYDGYLDLLKLLELIPRWAFLADRNARAAGALPKINDV